MPLPSFFQRLRHGSPAGAPAAALSASDIEQARTQARRRMIGMTVLVVVAVAVLSWLLETEPRQLPPSIRVVSEAASEPASAIAQVKVLEPAPKPALRDSTSASVAVASANKASAPAAKVTDTLSEDEEVVADEAASQASQPVSPAKTKPAAKHAAQPASQALESGRPKPAPKPVAKPTPKPEPKAAPKAAASVPVAATRYVVQVGAFTDGTAAHATRMKVEALGLKTYTQVVETSAGRKIRVRIGPYTSEAEAQKALATVRRAGVLGGILTF